MGNSIRFGIQGRVANSAKPNHRVWFVDDKEQSGGFLIFETWDGANGPNQHGAFDDWVESRADVDAYVQESNWIIVWDNGS